MQSHPTLGPRPTVGTPHMEGEAEPTTSMASRKPSDGQGHGKGEAITTLGTMNTTTRTFLLTPHILTLSLPSLPRRLPEEGPRRLPEEGLRRLPEEGLRRLPEEGLRHLPEEGLRHLPEGGSRHLLEGGSRHLLEEGPRHLLEGGSRHLLEEGPRHLLEGGSRHLLEEGPRHLLEEGPRHLLEGGSRHLLEEGPRHLVLLGEGHLGRRPVARLEEDLRPLPAHLVVDHRSIPNHRRFPSASRALFHYRGCRGRLIPHLYPGGRVSYP